MADPDRDPKHVHTVPDRKAAEFVAAWLTEKGYPAEVTSRPMATASDPFTGTVSTAPPEFEVWVVREADAVAARDTLADQVAGLAALREREAKRAGRTGTTTAACEECGKSSEWAAADMGTTQDCPHCGSYMDVPDPDDQWDDADFADEEPEAEKK